MKYVIKGDLAKLNEHDAANRANKFGGAALKHRMTTLVAAQLLGQPAITEPCVITFYWSYSSRHDFDNIRFACKYVLDGMVKAGILPNDNQQWVRGFGGDYFEKVSPSEVGVIIDVQTVESALR